MKRSQTGSADVSQLMSPMSCQSVLSFDTCSTSSTVWSPRSEQIYDDAMEMDSDCGPSFAFGSRHSLLDDAPSSSDAAINLQTACQQINALPQSDNKQLMLEVHGK